MQRKESHIFFSKFGSEKGHVKINAQQTDEFEPLFPLHQRMGRKLESFVEEGLWGRNSACDLKSVCKEGKPNPRGAAESCTLTGCLTVERATAEIPSHLRGETHSNPVGFSVPGRQKRTMHRCPHTLAPTVDSRPGTARSLRPPTRPKSPPSRGGAPLRGWSNAHRCCDHVHAHTREHQSPRDTAASAAPCGAVARPRCRAGQRPRPLPTAEDGVTGGRAPMNPDASLCACVPAHA